MTDKKSARMRIDMALIVKIRKRLDNFELNTDIQTDDDILALSGASGAGKTMILKTGRFIRIFMIFLALRF